jgi:hypothetical protein
MLVTIVQHANVIGTLHGSMNPWKYVLKGQRNDTASHYSLPYRQPMRVIP